VSETPDTAVEARQRPLDVGLMLPIWTDGSGLPDWTNGRGADGMRWRTAVANARLAETVGFDSVWVSEHHGAGDGYFPFGLSTSRARIYFAHVIVLSSI
jgi:alkanesulfonate monooxygenase SsuD/methylene tetrahydromethanopterin reductase-like flavin-dependent oxidoreductase (luciferase family)